MNFSRYRELIVRTIIQYNYTVQINIRIPLITMCRIMRIIIIIIQYFCFANWFLCYNFTIINLITTFFLELITRNIAPPPEPYDNRTVYNIPL